MVFCAFSELKGDGVGITSPFSSWELASSQKGSDFYQS